MNDLLNTNNNQLALTSKNLASTFHNLADIGESYFRPWTYDRPLLIRSSTSNRIAKLQKVMSKMIRYFVTHYHEYEELMPLTSQALNVLRYFQHTPYQIGSYRTDFVIDEKKKFRLIEITCRFALNGFWLSGFMNNMAAAYGQSHNIPSQRLYSGFLPYLQQKLGSRKVIILSHKGKSEESRHYMHFLEATGYDVKKVFVEEAEQELKDLTNKIFITEFNREDYFELSNQALQQLAKAKVINDPRTVFLIHDKRFLSVLGHQGIRENVLTPEEATLLDEFHIPTYIYGEAPEQWQAARKDKDRWILKHKHLGKSAQVYAGPTTTFSVWQSLFSTRAVDEMVLQPFIKQPRFQGKVNGINYDDYVVGTMLFFDDQYFGLGIFRTSSHPVTNVVDDRKRMHLHLLPGASPEKGYYMF